MSHSIKKSGIEHQYGLEQLGNTCYMNTAIQTLLAYPDLPTIVSARRQALQLLPFDALEGDDLQAAALCELLVLLSAKQRGEVISGTALADAWEIFLEYIRARVVDNSLLGSRQEDSSFALNLFLELLRARAPIQQKITKTFAKVTIGSQTYPERTLPSETLPCFVLKWPAGTLLNSLFEESSVEILDATHPDFYSRGQEPEYTSCKEKTNVLFSEGVPSAFSILPDHVVKKGAVHSFSPTECQYAIPAELELTINNQKHTYVLASFGQKIGSARGGHYIAYRRENDKWYELNDGRVSQQGTQALDSMTMPTSIQNALASNGGHCARQLVYVEKTRFAAQYVAQPVVQPEPPVVAQPASTAKEDTEKAAENELQEKLSTALAHSKQDQQSLLALQVKEQADLDMALSVSNNTDANVVKKDGDIWPEHLKEIIEKGGKTLRLPLLAEGEKTAELGLDLSNVRNWHILVGLLNHYPKISAVKIQYADIHADTQKNIEAFNRFLLAALKNRKGKVTVEIEPLDSSKKDELGYYTTRTYGRKSYNAKRLIWRGVLIAAVAAGIGVLSAVSMGGGLGILAGVLLAVGIDKFWQHRNRKFKARTLLEIKKLSVNNNVDAIDHALAVNKAHPAPRKLSKEGMAGFDEAVHRWPVKYWARFWASPKGPRAEGHALKDLGVTAEKAPEPPARPRLTDK